MKYTTGHQVGRSSRPHHGEPLQFSATASFLSKLYSNCIKLLRRSGVGPFKLSHYFLFSQVYYMLGDNPKKMSYMREIDGLTSKEPNPNILYGAMVAGPYKLDNFLDERKVMAHRATIASNADLVVALIALHDLPHKSSDSNDTHLGIDLLVSLKVFNLCHQLNVLQLVTNFRTRMKATKKIKERSW
ncbi:hypothetical protein H0E87_004241 [Populus deltoides]|uniref:cellulase n=1 Tax=Populus deltoides TaxID=3696 RepID=A0A8T2ZEG6_POPDE|nr:hypothetical protein H0E87_004241 [Populus deltoides]